MSLRELPINYKYMKYWAEKLRTDERKNYAKIEKIYIKLSSEVAHKLHKGYLEYLKEADKHRKGTKARLFTNDLLTHLTIQFCK